MYSDGIADVLYISRAPMRFWQRCWSSFPYSDLERTGTKSIDEWKYTLLREKKKEAGHIFAREYEMLG
jgi:hypothetical protein